MSISADPRNAVATARFFRVLGDATRLRILELLDAGEVSVGQLADATGTAQARISTHLACLRHCGFVSAERRGREVYYRLAIDALGGLFADVDRVMSPLVDQLASCTSIGPDWI